MIQQYIQKALAKAHYEMTHDPEPYYGEIAELPGVWAAGETLEQCRERLIEILEGWLVLRLRNNLSVPGLDGVEIAEPNEISVS